MATNKTNSQLIVWTVEPKRTVSQLTKAYNGLALPAPAPTTKAALVTAIVAHLNALPPANVAAYQPPVAPARPAQPAQPQNRRRPAPAPRTAANNSRNLPSWLVPALIGFGVLALIAMLALALLFGVIIPNWPNGNGNGDSGSGNPPVVTIGDGNLNWAYQQGAVGSNAFCKALSKVVGGPDYKWWGTQNPDGTSVANSCIMREVDDTDGVLGYEFNLPAGTVWHIWLVDPSKPNVHVAVTAVGPAKIQSPFLVSRATGYFGTNVTFGHPGEWTYGIWEGNSTPTCSWTAIGTTPAVCNTTAPLSAAAAAGYTTAGCMSTLHDALITANATITSSAANYYVVTLPKQFTVPVNVIPQWSGNSGNTAASDGSMTVPAGTATLYCK